jgi:hypothetical protein
VRLVMRVLCHAERLGQLIICQEVSTHCRHDGHLLFHVFPSWEMLMCKFGDNVLGAMFEG